MDRRHFTHHLGWAGALVPFLAAFMPGHPASTQISKPAIKPARLRPGDKVGLITPGSYIPERTLEKAVNNIRTLGFNPVLSQNIRAKKGYIAGTDEQRLSDLHAMFSNPDIRAVWCARGGYGCTRLLPHIDYELIRRNPKIFIGYSDITALHLAIHQMTGLICFHGPVGGSDFTEYSVGHLKAVLVEGRSPYTIRTIASHGTVKYPDLYTSQVLRAGKVRAPLFGGNLSLLAAMAGTPFAFDATGKLVFIEDIDEKPYRVDRMLTQLRQSAKLDKAAGFALGIFNGCVPEPGDESLTLAETIADRFGDIRRPAVYGLTFGHIANQCTLPIGLEAELDAQALTITLTEAAVS
jgi:muramoyltetrapeptide carboxypeptidase